MAFGSRRAMTAKTIGSERSRREWLWLDAENSVAGKYRFWYQGRELEIGLQRRIRTMSSSHDQTLDYLCLMADPTVRRISPPERTKLRRDTAACVAATFRGGVPSFWIGRETFPASSQPGKTISAPLLATDPVMDEE
jgi:hypothetical protein